MEFVADSADSCSHLNGTSDLMTAILQNGHHVNTSGGANNLGIYNDIFLSRYIRSVFTNNRN